ncbi:sigma factor-like helix-turn-helix DNA-binding protein [Actinomadura rupiterrae]|uniref:sigma-70 region 4 domain-containing protein n=1 Tax=Actinomadura rupiterrae TaxID=559627 RepID=UPI0020A5B9D8|nr:sigma-70 region 4 domain-containing protein [Actinomadura rupiterrae]MCP2339957.1 DNA-directed RNA polymerase specialized sigma24 family protein [Actinomadura rupiterrae]
MRGDPASLYDAHAARLYAHGWSLLGDDAAAAVHDAFVAAVRHPPRGDVVLWMYALSRTAAESRGAFSRPWHVAAAEHDPLLRAAAALRAEQREALLLDAGEWLELPDIARILGLAPDTVRQLLHSGRTRLERGVLDALMRGEAGAGAAEVIAAFEKGTLPRLLAGRAPEALPEPLRDSVLASYEREVDEPSPTATSPSPLVVIGSAALGAPAPGTAAHKAAASGRKRSGRRLGAVAGLAASAAAAVGMLASWTASRGSSAGSIEPSARTDRTASVTGATGPSTTAKAPGLTGTERTIGTTPPGSGDGVTTSQPGSAPEAGGPPSSGSPSSPSTPPSTGPGTGSPTGPGTGTAPPSTTPPSTPPPSSPPPSNSGSTGPSTPPPTVPPTQPEPTPAPSPTGTPTSTGN